MISVTGHTNKMRFTDHSAYYGYVKCTLWESAILYINISLFSLEAETHTFKKAEKSNIN